MEKTDVKEAGRQEAKAPRNAVRRQGVQECTVLSADDDIRLDRWFRRHYPGLAHASLSKLLRTGQIRLDGRRARPGDRVRSGQRIRIPPLPVEVTQAPKRERRRREAPPLSEAERQLARDMLLYEDDFVIVLNKPAGLATQGGPGITRHVDRLAVVYRRHGEDEVPRLVHRLDRDTSGVLVLARDARSAAMLARAFKGRTARKLYWALVRGVPKGMQGEISAPLAKVGGRAGERVEVSPAGKPARTVWRRLDRAGGRAAWLALEPLTGRTHQLRAHLAHIG
ncbi:MAG: RluA family pseudouridine synthase, partial [Alphaproteobacteria bacterium]